MLECGHALMHSSHRRLGMSDATATPVISVFLSHSSADHEVCDAYVRALRGAGADVWYDEHVRHFT